MPRIDSQMEVFSLLKNIKQLRVKNLLLQMINIKKARKLHKVKYLMFSSLLLNHRQNYQNNT